MIDKEIEVSVTKTTLKKIRFSQGEYEWTESGGIIRNDGPTMLYLLFKTINPDTSISVSNLKDEIDKANLTKF